MKSTDSDVNFYVSLTDLFTLLVVFFVYLFSISEIDILKFFQMKEVLSGKSIVSEEQIESMDLLKQLKQEQQSIQEMTKLILDFIESESLHQVFTVSYFHDRLVLNLGSALLFELGSAELKADAINVLEVIGQLFLSTKSQIVVEGHTDSLPMKTELYPSNWELSAARASSVVRFLSKLGIKESRFKVVGLSQYQPLTDEQGVAQTEMNRRVSIILRPQITAEVE